MNTRLVTAAWSLLNDTGMPPTTTRPLLLAFLSLLAQCSGETPASGDSATNADAIVREKPQATISTSRWDDISDNAFAEAAAAETRLESAGAVVQTVWLAQMAWYGGRKFGWTSADATARMKKLLGRRLSSNGWGSGEAWVDGSGKVLRAAGTTYAITTAWHAGRVLLAAYDAGALPSSYLVGAANALLNFPRVPGSASRCIAYSSAGYDQTHTGCVYNVEATSAWFLWAVEKRGLISSGVLSTANAWHDDVVAHFNTRTGIWPYSNESLTPQETWHNGPVVWAMTEMLPHQADPTSTTDSNAWLAGEFKAWPADGGNSVLVSLDCPRGDAQYDAIHASANQGCTVQANCNTQVKRDKAVMTSRTPYVVEGSLIQDVCGIWAGE
ncbi:MAG TPA: hypothetical protein VNO21_03435 [Polyangiaceae bacterium]|nr:hypothetical protein [Polyangiaceae bacterium]